MDLKFSKKRDRHLMTPCCNKNNKDGKFVSFKNLNGVYGYCHACGKTTLPLKLNNYQYDTISNPQSSSYNQETLKYIPESKIWDTYLYEPKNNLSLYLIKSFTDYDVNETLKNYVVGTDKYGGTVFWYINNKLKVQKSKIVYYDTNGRRKDKFSVPYKNKDGYYFCLFGQHLIPNERKGIDTLILVESEKTALVGDILFPKYTWLAYSGINGLTDHKIVALKGHRVIIVPDLSENAFNVMYNKLSRLNEICKYIKILDLRDGKTDQELKKEGIFNHDLEDFIRNVLDN